MSQSAFGDKLGVSRDVINNIEQNRLARPDQKLSLLKLIASKFNVREEWLLTGEEPMEEQSPPDPSSDDELDAILHKYGLPHELKKLFLRVGRLPEESQALIRDWLYGWILDAADEIRDVNAAIPTMKPTRKETKEERIKREAREEAEEYYRLRLAEKRRIAKEADTLDGTGQNSSNSGVNTA